MDITLSFNQKLGKRGILYIKTVKLPTPMDLPGWVHHQMIVSEELTKCKAVNDRGIFCEGLNTFTKTCGAEVKVDFTDLNWENIDKRDVCAVAEYITAAVKLVQKTFEEKYPAFEASITFNIDI